MTDTEFKDAIKKNGLSGGYFLFGDEDFIKNKYAADMCAAVCAGQLDDINTVKLSAAETSPAALEEALSEYPVMAERKAVLLYGFSENVLSESVVSAYIDVFSRTGDYPHTVLAVVSPAGSVNVGDVPKRPSKLYKRLSEFLTPVQFDRKSEASLKKWIITRLEHEGATVDFDAPGALIARCGRDMNILAGECEKLAAYSAFHGGKCITPDMVKNVCSEYAEDDVFALANAVIAGDRRGALSALEKYREKERRDESAAVTASLGRVISDMFRVCVLQQSGMDKRAIASALGMHEYRCSLYMRAVRGIEPARLRAALERCFETDRLIKSSDLKYIAVERLICTIPAKRQ